MYTWGYLKNVALAKLDLTNDEDEVNEQNLLEKFIYYANEVITQISSSVKPKATFASFDVVDEEYIDRHYGSPTGTNTYESIAKDNGKTLVFSVVTMPTDFVSFGDDVNWVIKDGHMMCTDDEDFRYVGHNQLMFFGTGKYSISYNARWIDFSNVPSVDGTYSTGVYDSFVIPVPADILDCIPSYIASQCFKIDDQYKAQVFRNEYEMFVARIDDTTYKNTKTFTIGGDW